VPLEADAAASEGIIEQLERPRLDRLSDGHDEYEASDRRLEALERRLARYAKRRRA